jgi:predicted exporter
MNRFLRAGHWLLLLVLVVWGGARLRFDSEILNLLPSRLEVVQGLRLYQRHFTDAQELVVTVEAPAPEMAESATRSLAQVLRVESNLVSRVVWQPAWMENPGEAAELIAFLWLNQPPAAFAELTGRLAPANLADSLEETRRRLATSLSPDDMAAGGYDPYGLLRLPETLVKAHPAFGTGDEGFASADGTFRLAFVQARPPLDDYRACRSWMAELKRIVATAQTSGAIPPEVRVGYTGRPAFVTEIAGSMENDMAGSSSGTLATIGILFWLTHRRLRPLVWLLAMLVMILAGTLALGGLCIGTLNVVSLGFAAILLGLAEDFGIVIYQESRSHPDLDAPALRRRAGPGILWSAATTAGAFFALNLSALPGLGQLGTLVALGILLAAVGMLYGYLPLLLRLRRPADREMHQARPERLLLFQPAGLLPTPVSWSMTGVLLLAAGVVLGTQGVPFDRSPEALEPRNSEARATLGRVQRLLGQPEEPLWVLVPGRDEADVARRLARVQATLAAAVSREQVTGFTLPTVLWPDPDNQQANRSRAASLVDRRGQLRDAALGAGFTAEALRLTENILQCWQAALSGTNVFWPTNGSSRWLLDKIAARTGQGVVALGLLHPSTTATAPSASATGWARELHDAGALVSGWSLLGRATFDLVLRELPRVLVPVFVLVVVSLWLAFRSVREVLLSLATLAFSAVMLGAVMNLLGWKWNLMNLMALPLLLGMGVDFSIHMQLALRDHGGNRLEVRRSTGRALLLAGATTIAGFASLSFSTNAGMASLGRTCALGIALALLTGVYLLPVWWGTSRGPLQPPRTTGGGVNTR